jgi:signal transduction histidine kinase
MPEFPLPASVSERQDAGRHGRPPHRGKRRPVGTRAYHLYISLVPTALMGLLGLAATTNLLMVGTSSAAGRLALVVIAAAAVIVLGAAAFGADAATRRERHALGRRAAAPVATAPVPAGPDDTQRRLAELGFHLQRGRQELQSLRERVAAGETPPPRGKDAHSAPEGDPFAQLAYEMRLAQNEAWNAVIGIANTRGANTAQRVEVFVNLARRMQTLSHRAIQGLDELESQVEDPDLLKGLFRVDHLSTRMRRQAESLAVIGGAASRRQWSRPVTVYEVLRSAIAEVEHYNRVKVVPPVEGTLDGGAVADVIHLLAELIENATKFAPPHTQVLIRAEPVTAGLVIEVEDRGLGIPRESQRRMNDLLADLDRIDVDEFLQEGRIGLLVVSALSRRHHIAVRLNTNLYGGTQAVVVLPNTLIGAEQQEAPAPLEKASESAPPVPALAAGGAATLTSSTPLSDWVSDDAQLPQQSGYEAAAHLSEPAPAAPRNDQSAAASVHQAETSTGVDDASGGQRPELPRRRAQQNLAPELQHALAPEDDDDTDTGHNPSLMAAFQQGMRSARENEGPADRPGGTG